ncbi:DUF3054 domain-containing protein [Halomicrobium salinisoli]|uniref:DUF3054 domain-containing protein n=1 Tax=Halomicrobium salinisoli TaxID=2878391 RepID=UPI001CF0A6B6|nr:DUF3054 domain-containing protein [Halomicrobium salinisoli]
MSTVSSLRGRIDASSLTAALAAGDVAAIALFVLLGQTMGHSMNPLANPERVAGTLAPFLIGWVVASLVGSLYTRDALRPPVRAVSWTLPAWILAVVVAQALRATALFPGGAALTFALVSIAVGGALLVGWRLAIAAVLSRR